MPSTSVLRRNSRDCVQFCIEARRRRKVVGPVAVPGGHTGLQGIRFRAGVCRLQGVEVG